MIMLWGSISPRQREIWGLRRNGKTESEISRELSISRQSVHIMLNAAQGKIMQALNEAALVNRIQVSRMDVAKGVLVGYSPEFAHKVVITYSPGNGVRLWYEHDEDCQQCKLDREWVKVLLEEAGERGVVLSQRELHLPPAQLARAVFQKILGGGEV